MIFLTLLASLSFAQSSGTAVNFEDGLKIQNVAEGLRELQSGRPVITGIPRFANGICFAENGTDCMTTAPAASGVTFVSTYVYIAANFNVANTDEGVCVGTATWTSIGGQAIVSFTAVATGASSTDRPRAGFLIDGLWQAPYTTIHANCQSDTLFNSCTFAVPLHSALTAGERKLCLSAWRSGGSNGTFRCSETVPCVLHILEWK